MQKFLKIILICILFLVPFQLDSRTLSAGHEAQSVNTQNNTCEQLVTIINEVKEQYCPDERVSVFNITSKIDSNKIALQGDVLLPEARNELLEKVKNIYDHTIEDQINVLPDSASREKPYGIIRISVAQLRKEPHFSAEMISQAIMGSEIRILKSGKRYFYYCQMEDGYLGWMSKSSFVTGNENFIENWRKVKKLVVTSLFCQVWEKRTENSNPVSDLVRGNKIILIKSHRKWYQVRLPDGRKGYVKSKFVIKEETLRKKYNPDANQIIKTAKTLLGHPYLWGGNSVKALDCSGFTQSVFKLHGIQLSRDANMQVHEGVEVSIEDNLKYLKKADLIFFGRSNERITHVGIYIGDHRFIHSSGFVQIDSLNPEDENYNEYRQNGLRAVRRVLK